MINNSYYTAIQRHLLLFILFPSNISFAENSIAYDHLLTEEEIQEMHSPSRKLHDLGEIGYGCGTFCSQPCDESSTLTYPIKVIEVPLQSNLFDPIFFEWPLDITDLENEEEE